MNKLCNSSIDWYGERRDNRGRERRGKSNKERGREEGENAKLRKGVLVHLEDEGSGEGENTSEETSSLEGGRSARGS